MDDDTRDLFIQLCTRAGIIMEDASAIALTVSGRDLDTVGTAIGELETAARKVGHMITAAKSLLD